MSAASGRADRALRRLLALETAILLAAFAALIAVTFADVALRRLSGSGLLFARELGIAANIWLSLLGIGIASSHGAHLRPRFLDHWVAGAWQAWFPRLQEALTALGFAALGWIAFGVMLQSRELGDTTQTLRWPVWLLQSCMPLAFGFAAVKHALYAAFPGLRPAEQGEVPAVPGP